ncbi:g11269 [Coccomyxa viridis]|uniref:G11269 protein n=1 Tax=Coccomyxa viridis TaxID=1274662 RepID=A0ABP1G7H5_9CHLO
MEGLTQYGDSDSDQEQQNSSAPSAGLPGTGRNGDAEDAIPSVQPVPQSMGKTTPQALPSAAALLSQGGISSMRAGDPPTFKRSAPLSSAARLHAAPGLQKAARRGAASSATQGRSSSAAVSAFLPPQLKGRPNVITEDLDKMGVKKRRSSGQGQAGQQR